MSPTGNFLATAHVSYLGVYLWANKMLYDRISLRSIDPYQEAPYVDLPSFGYDSSSLEDDIQNLNLDDGEEVELNYKSVDQISDDLITLSGLPQSRWQNLLDLDIIKKRNKPKLPPTKPKSAPFFLPTVAGTEFKFDLSNVERENADSKVFIPKDFSNLTTFGKLLEKAEGDEGLKECIEYLKKLGPSMIDFEIKSLHPIGGGSYKAMVNFMKMILFVLRSNKDFELAQAYMATFLRSHGRAVTETPELCECLKEVQEVQGKSWKLLQDELLYVIGVVDVLRNYVNKE